MSRFSRRRFLVLSAAASAAACTGGKGAESGAGSDAGSDADSGTADLPLVALSKPPWVQPLTPSTVRLRFETRESRALPVTLAGPAGEVTATPSLREDDLTYAWGLDDADTMPDEPGFYVVQEVLFEDLVPGETYAWRVDLGGGEQASGSFRAPPARGDTARVAWLADSMWPRSADVAAVAASQGPDLVVHGGDMVYQSSPIDTWSTWFQIMAGLTGTAAMAVTPGNHEFEDMDEAHVMFDRLLMPQGRAEGARYGSFDVAGVRWLVFDTESGSHGDAEAVADQQAWLESALAEAAADDAVTAIIVGMHRPMYTFSKYWVEEPTERDARHALFQAHGVSLVLCGHCHAYEHFVVDGVHYVVDGGAGALLYDPDEELEAATAARPDEVALRVASSKSYGFTLLDIAADGAISVQRLEADSGSAIDAFEIAAPS
ncbi:MAG: metallophosphoesterase [Alphaproteobacteria bacterium]|nr:metallophosphoesterase [Alphaproteobacteria bacterium]